MRFNTISKFIAASALTCATTVALAAPVPFTLTWDLPNTYDNNGNPFDAAHSTTYWGSAAWEGATSTKLWWGDPSSLELFNDTDGGTRLTHYNSSVPETTRHRSVAQTNLLLSFDLYGLTYSDSFAVVFNETLNPGNDIFTIAPFEFTRDYAGGDGYVYSVTFVSDTPSTLYEAFQNGQFDTEENSYSYVHFSMTAERTGTVPEPGVLALLGIGIAGFVGMRRRRA
ncbi:MAG: PEP-CTERM sorting domain-containing protein [Azoarcus sp.]|jgi:hypothetical protein|nr:PEP-CTERM sorting domain-containing protein [Azoarcus sp.]